MAVIASPTAPAFVNALQERGRYTFTRNEAIEATARPVAAVDKALGRLVRQERIARPRRGFFVIVPAEYRVAGCPPASWFIDDLMSFLEQPYYVALLSAASMFGAAHQQPMVFQVMTDRLTRPARAGRVWIEFHESRTVREVPVTSRQTDTSQIPVSTAEVTALDLVRYVHAAGYLSNVATVLIELAEVMDGSVIPMAATTYPTPVLQRLGYLLDFVGESRLSDSVLGCLADRRVRRVKLAHHRPVEGASLDEKWRVIVNDVVDPDL